MQVVRERELKFEVPDGWTVPDLHDLTPGGRVEQVVLILSTTYVDTADYDLLASSVTLRRRVGDADEGWQLKVPRAGARDELRAPLNGRGVPRELQDLLCGIRGGAPLRQVARLQTERTAYRLQDPDGVTLAELADDRVTATVPGNPPAVRAWREIEVELLDGTEQVLVTAARTLRRAGARPSRWPSKLARALDRPAPVRLRPAKALDRLVEDYLSVQHSAILTGDLELRMHSGAAVHSTRVATRRYRSALRVFGPALDASRTAHLDGELAWYAGVLGAVRDQQVLRPRLATLLEKALAALEVESVRTHIEQSLAAADEAAWAVLQRALAGRRYAALLADLRTWTDAVPVRGRRRRTRDVSALVDEAARTATKRHRRARNRDDSALTHRARKAAKRARYAAELAQPVLGKPGRRLRKKMARRQTQLGHAQDRVLVADFLRHVADGVDGPAGFTLGRLAEFSRSRPTSGR